MKYLRKFETKEEFEATIFDENNTPNVSYCEEDESMKYIDKIDSYNGYEYVDLGLPSGLKWAKCNVGAKNPEDAGLYFQWGDPHGYANATEHTFDWENYKWSIDGSSSNFSKYNTVGATLDLEDDAARANMGGLWRMPTAAEIDELIDNANWDWTTNYEDTGKAGYIVKSKTNGNSIFMPVTGYYDVSSLDFFWTDGAYWSSSQYSDDSNGGYGMPFGSDYLWRDYYDRCLGFSVRGVAE